MASVPLDTPAPNLQPLAAAMDQLEDYGVVLVDRAKLRFFFVSLGEIEEVATEEGDGKRVRHIKTSGFDNADSSSRIQRKADNQVRANLTTKAADFVHDRLGPIGLRHINDGNHSVAGERPATQYRFGDAEATLVRL